MDVCFACAGKQRLQEGEGEEEDDGKKGENRDDDGGEGR